MKTRIKFLETPSLLLLVLIIHFQMSSICRCAVTHKAPKISTTGFNARSKSHKNQNENNFEHRLNVINDDFYESTLSSNVTIPDEQLLIARLLKNYDPAARPVYNASKTVVVKFGFLLVQICDMDERNQILTTNVWLEQEWIDERLQWNESEYNNLDKIRIPCNRIWLPDIVLYNSADDFTESFMQSKAMIKSNGEVFWPPPAKLRSSCKIDVTFFPFDDQVCHIKFGSWTYSGLQLDLVNKSHTTDLVNYIKSGEWDLKYVIVERNIQYYPCCPEEPYPDIVFYIHIRRRVLYYLFNIIFPCVWLSILSLIGFWLPPDTGEKITLGITVLLAFSVFMLLIAENIPATSEMVPLIGIYLTVTMGLTSMSIILTVFVLQLHYAGHYSPRMSRRVYDFMTRKIAYYICMSSTVEQYESHMRRNMERFESTGDQQADSRAAKLSNFEKELSKLKLNLGRESTKVRSDSSSTSTSSNSMSINSQACPNVSCCCFCSPIERKLIKQNGQQNDHITRQEQYTMNHVGNKYTDRKTTTTTTTSKKTNLAYPDDFDDVSLLEYSNSTTTRRSVGDSIELKPRNYDNYDEAAVKVTTRKQQHQHTYLEKLNSNQMTHTNNKNRAFSFSPNSVINPKPISPNPNQQQNSTSTTTVSCPRCQNKSPLYDYQSSNRELIDSLEIFSKNLKEYLVKQEIDAIKSNFQSEWKLVAHIVDRILFWVFTFLTVVSSLILLVAIPVWKNQYLSD